MPLLLHREPCAWTNDLSPEQPKRERERESGDSNRQHATSSLPSILHPSSQQSLPPQCDHAGRVAPSALARRTTAGWPWLLWPVPPSPPLPLDVVSVCDGHTSEGRDRGEGAEGGATAGRQEGEGGGLKAPRRALAPEGPQWHVPWSQEDTCTKETRVRPRLVADTQREIEGEKTERGGYGNTKIQTQEQKGAPWNESEDTLRETQRKQQTHREERKEKIFVSHKHERKINK